MQGAPHPENARKFLDFIAGNDVQSRLETEFSRRPVREGVESGGVLRPLEELVLVDYDLAWTVEHHDSILMSWAFYLGGRGGAVKKRHSFHRRLFAGFLLASLLPLLLCSAMLLQIFRLRLDSQLEEESREQLDHVISSLDGLYRGFQQTALALQASPYVAPALSRGQQGQHYCL